MGGRILFTKESHRIVALKSDNLIALGNRDGQLAHPPVVDRRSVDRFRLVRTP
jgi:hypothetical protein